ncbi:hypothetical protein Rxyl_1945 [Rubrobacter xylanophilus DSM 9941]|uniref:Right handed beta helix domain-containing protein n=1 Tax=Rubrobacter xylanophilus (strain DSM 9941 / JCM 11954 / NBRC 16129 / PRD-1) TaxID=266117 RepID=Q1AUN6_RUBXD|nr:right-handed parallel beta-helix repeat-containing protein [Rubrobacter xylanophilus]ABG04892.1 hypothetical protein Rxyl_1945 [Rubrobacter xylanophilus DSM 9941]
MDSRGRQGRARRASGRVWALAGALLLALALQGLSAPEGREAGAATACDRYASVKGSDRARGTASAPFRTVQRLADSLRDGQVGCLRTGTYTAPDGTVKVRRAGITLRSAPGHRATIKARAYVVAGANRATLKSLKILGAPGKANVLVRADRVRLIRNNITNNNRPASCILVGSRANGGIVASGTRIRGNRIHHCGELPRSNRHHGIYVSAGRATSITNNLIYANANRGIQLYPDARGSLIKGNIIDGNGEGVLFSGAGPYASSDNAVKNNVISNSRRWNVYSVWNQTSRTGSGNVVSYNCLWASSANPRYRKNGGISGSNGGFSAHHNVFARPLYADRDAGDFRLGRNSNCRKVFGG